jgi:hypothetical protein
MTAAASEVEPEPPEIRQKFLLNHITQMIEPWRSTLEFASGTFEIPTAVSPLPCGESLALVIS